VTEMNFNLEDSQKLFLR